MSRVAVRLAGTGRDTTLQGCPLVPLVQSGVKPKELKNVYAHMVFLDEQTAASNDFSRILNSIKGA